MTSTFLPCPSNLLPANCCQLHTCTRVRNLSAAAIYELPEVLFCPSCAGKYIQQLYVCRCMLVSVHMLFYKYCMCIYNAVVQAQLMLQQTCTLQAPVCEHRIQALWWEKHRVHLMNLKHLILYCEHGKSTEKFQSHQQTYSNLLS